MLMQGRFTKSKSVHILEVSYGISLPSNVILTAVDGILPPFVFFIRVYRGNSGIFFGFQAVTN
jgi:hypothetical protein